MTSPGYRWRHLTPEQRIEVLAGRKANSRPWHSPPHPANYGRLQFHVSAACYEHRPWIGQNPARMDAFAENLLSLFESQARKVYAWCLLPNHYHGLIETPDIKGFIQSLGRLHGRTSHQWNGEDDRRGRKVFYRAVDRAIRSERHYWATLNYVHHNAVHHGYVKRWTDWPWSSAPQFLKMTSPAEAQRIWREYPLHDYGRGWDDERL